MIVSLQYLRGIAAMLVVAFHAVEALSRLHGAPPGFSFGPGVAGVDIFFVISGFIIAHTTAESDIGPLAFIRHRIVRIVPLYWTLTLLVAAVALIRPELMSSTVYDTGHLLASLFFIPVQHPLLDETLPMLIPGWTLNYEMAFYLVFALALVLPKRAQVPAVLAVLVSAVALREIIPYRPITAFYTLPLILEFGAGMLIAKAYRSPLPVSARLAALAFALGWAALLALDGTGLWRSLTLGAPAALIVAGAVFFERARGMPRLGLPQLLGDASYSIYLGHVLIIPVLARLWTAAGLSETTVFGALFVALAFVVSALGGVILYLAVERPLLRLLRGGPRPGKDAPVALTPRASPPVRGPSRG